MLVKHTKTVAVTLAATLLLTLAAGCESGGRIPPSPEPPPRPEPPVLQPGAVPFDPHYDYTCYAPTNTWYRQDKQTCQWEKYNPNTGQWEPCAPPWWAGQVDPIPVDPTPTQVQNMPTAQFAVVPAGCGCALLRTAIDYGITPDSNGMVSPLVWVTTFQGISQSTLTAEDTLDFFMAVSQNWSLATDSDPALLAAIGPENVVWHPLDLGPEQPSAAILELNNVSVRNLALFIHGSGLAGIDSHTPYGKWELRYDAQSNAVTIKWKGDLVGQVPLD